MVNNRNRNNNRNNGGKGNGRGRGAPGPQRRFAPQQQNVVRARPQIPSGLPLNHHFNAFGPQKPQALAFSIGPATHIGGLATSTQTSSTTQPVMFIFQPSGGYNQLGKCTTADGGVNFAWSNINITSTGIDPTGAGPSAVSPSQVLCSRGSIRVRNTSRAADAGGVIRVLRTGTPLSTNTAQLGELYDMVKNHPRTHSYTGSSLTMAHQWDCIPVDQSSYCRFVVPTGAYQALNAGETAVSSIVIVMESFSTLQDYELTMAACYYGRYRYAGPLASMASLPPTVPLARTNMLRDVAEHVGSAGRKVGAAAGNAFTAAATQHATRAAEGFAGNLFRQNANPGRLGGRTSMITSIAPVMTPEDAVIAEALALA